MDRAMTVRFSADEMREIVKLASAAGVSQAELVRRHWRQRGSGSMSVSCRSCGCHDCRG